MRYINTETGAWPLSIQDVRAALPNTLYKVPPEPYKQIFEAPIPRYNQVTEFVLESTPVLTHKGTYEQVWQIVRKFAPDSAEETAAIAEASALAQKQIIKQFDEALTAHLDKAAQSKRYDNRITCALRAGYMGPFQAEGQAFASWMDACNYQAYQVMSEVLSGTRNMPTVQEFIDSLPEMVWPA